MVLAGMQGTMGLPERPAGLFLPRKGEPLLALAGGEDWRSAMAGAMPPHFVGRNSALLRPRLAARTAPAPFLPPLPTKSTILRGPLFCEKRECAVHGGREKTGPRKGYFLRVRMSPARGVVRAGVWRLSNRLSPLSAAANLAVGGEWLVCHLLSVGAAALKVLREFDRAGGGGNHQPGGGGPD